LRRVTAITPLLFYAFYLRACMPPQSAHVCLRYNNITVLRRHYRRIPRLHLVSNNNGILVVNAGNNHRA